MRLSRLYAPVFAAALASCAGGGPGPGAATALAGGSVHCNPFDSVDVHGKEYVVQANEWNSKQTQCLSVNETAFAVTEANFSLPSAGPPASFPSIYKGCHWGNCTDRSGLPALASSLPAVPSHWTVTSTASGAYDIAYDLWFDQTGDRERAAQRDRAHESGSTTQEASSRRAAGSLPSQSAGRCGTSGRGRC